MVDLDLYPHSDPERSGCPVFHLFPRFVRDVAGEWLDVTHGVGTRCHVISEIG